jgi:hypothetical protein
MTTFPFDRRKPIIVDPATRASRWLDSFARQAAAFRRGRIAALPDSLRSGPILFLHGAPLLAVPTQPVGDPVPRPGTPQPTPHREPEDPVQAPHPREPELPAIDPHEPGLPDTRIGRYEPPDYDDPAIGDPPRSTRTSWLV